MKIEELRKISDQELVNLLKEKRKKVQELKLALASQKVKNVKELAVIKKDIAKILTILNKK